MVSWSRTIQRELMVRTVTYVWDIPLAQRLVDLGYLLQLAPNRHSPPHTVSHSRKELLSILSSHQFVLVITGKQRRTHHQDIRCSDDHNIPVILDGLRWGCADCLNEEERA